MAVATVLVAAFVLGPLAGVASAAAANALSATAGTTPQSTTVGSAFGVALQVKVTDGLGLLVIGDPVSFVAAPGPMAASSRSGRPASTAPAARCT